MSDLKTWKRGGVQVAYRPSDGTLQVYAPESNRWLSAELGESLLDFLLELIHPVREVSIEPVDLTGSGDLTGPEALTTTEQEADKQAELARQAQQQSTVPSGDINTTEGPAKRGPGRPRKTS